MNYKEHLEMIMMLGVLFIGSVQPMVMVLSLIMITLVYSYMMMKYLGSFWYSYVLMLVMLSGVLVLFTYMVSLIPNESFELLGFMNFGVILVLLSVSWELGEVGDGAVMSLKIWEVWMGGLNIYVVLYLLMMMIMVVWIGMSGKESLRI